MQLTYQLRVDDYHQAYIGFRKQRAFVRWAYRVGYACLVLVIAVVLLIIFFAPDNSVRTHYPLYGLLFMWLFILWYSPLAAARKAISGPGNALLRTVEISDAGIHSKTELTETTLAWGSLAGWVEGKRVFTLFTSPVSFFPIPKRAMSAEQQEEFRARLRQHMKS